MLRAMSGVRAADVVVGLVTENTPRMLTQAIRLLRSIRWFGGELSNAHDTFQSLGAEIRTVKRFHAANPTANRHQLIAELLDAPENVVLILDCDTIVTRDPLLHLNADA